MRFFSLFIVYCCLVVAHADASELRKHTHELSSVTGLLMELDPQKCLVEAGCGPTFSLLDETHKPVLALQGDAIPTASNLSGLIVKVTGTIEPLSKEHLGAPGYGSIKQTMNVSELEARSSIHYYPFLVDQADSYTIHEYGCQLRWDKSYSWKQAANRIEIAVTMTDTLDSGEKLTLIYDATSGAFITNNTTRDFLAALPSC